MSLNSEIRAKTQEASYHVRVGNHVLTKIESIAMDFDFDQASGTCTIICPKKWSIEPNDRVEVDQGYSGFNRRRFTGFVDDVDKETFPKHMVVRCRDVLKKATDNYIVDEIEYDSVQAEDIVKDLLERSGLYDYALDTTNFTVGDVEPAKFSLIFAFDAIRSIADLIGWRCWAETSGKVIFRKVYPRGALNYRWAYTKDPTFGSESGIIHIIHVASDIDLRNWIEVWGWTNPSTGVTIEATAYADSPYVPDPPRYRKAVISSELIDTQAMADWVAERVLGELNQLVDKMEATIQGNPKLHVGNTIRVVEDWTDMSDGLNYFIYGISSEMRADGLYQMTLDLRGGRYSEPTWPDGEDPIACFSVKQVGWGDPYWVVYVDASCSEDPDGEIASYDWDWGDASGHGSGMRANHIYSSGSPGGAFTIILTVTDDDGLTGQCSKNIVIGSSGSGVGVYDRVLYFADSTGRAYGSPDSGNTWNYFATSGACNQVAVNSADLDGYAWFGDENGKLYKSADYCVTGTLVYTFGAAITALWLNRVNDQDLLVGLSDGKVYRSLDQGASWLLLATFQGPVYWVLNYSTAAYHIWAGGGTTTGWLRQSTDGGATWTDHGSAFGLESVRDGCIHFLIHIGAACRTDPSPVRLSDDGGSSWTSPSGISDENLNTITADPYDENIKLAGGDGGLSAWLTTDGSTFSSSGSLGSGTKVLKLLIDQELYATVFGGTDDDLELSFDHGAVWKQLLDAPGDVNDIAQGPLLEKGEQTVLVATAADGVYRTEGWTAPVPSWLLKNNGLGDIRCNDLIKDPFNKGVWWLLTLDGLYKTTDDGDTWIQNATIPTPESSGRTPQYMAICYGASEGTIYVAYTAWQGGGGDRAYLLKTTDGGGSWGQLWIPGRGVWPDDASFLPTSLCVSLEDDNLVYLTGYWIGRPRAWKINWPSTVTEIRYSSLVAAFNIHSPRNHDDWVWLFGLYGPSPLKSIERSTNEGSNWVDSWTSMGGIANAVISHYMNYMDVICSAGVANVRHLYEATQGLAPWTEIADLGSYISSTGIICTISRKPTDLDYIIVGIRDGSESYPTKIMLTKDRGQTWQDKTGAIPHDCGAIRAIAGPWDEDTVSAGPAV